MRSRLPSKGARPGEREIPYCLPTIGQEEIDEVVDSLRSGWLTTGPKTRQFEQEFAEAVGAKFAIATNSCTAGLLLCLAGLDVGPGDEVIVPTQTFCATANVVVNRHATPVIVDVTEDGQIDPEAVELAITPRTKAIIPVHYAGQACDLDEIRDLADEHRIAVIEDAAHAVGCEYKGQPIGSSGNAVFSFYATKNLTTGEGGMVVTDNEALHRRLGRLVMHGMTHSAYRRYQGEFASAWYYEVEEPGFKANMSDLTAAIGLHQLRKLPFFTRRRRHIAAMYKEGLSDLPVEFLPRPKSDRTNVYHLFPVLLGKDVDRNRFFDYVFRQGITLSVHFVPLHRHPYYAKLGYKPSDFPVGEDLYDREVSLPLYPELGDLDVEYVIETVRNAVRG